MFFRNRNGIRFFLSPYYIFKCTGIFWSKSIHSSYLRVHLDILRTFDSKNQNVHETKYHLHRNVAFLSAIKKSSVDLNFPGSEYHLSRVMEYIKKFKNRIADKVNSFRKIFGGLK